MHGWWSRVVVGVWVASLVFVAGCSGSAMETDRPRQGTARTADEGPNGATSGAADATATGEPGDTAAETATEAETTVTAAGFVVELQDLVVSSPAGVAPIGTPVTVQLLGPELQIEDAEIVQTVDVQLGEGLQPQEVITLTFTATEPRNDTSAYVVMRSDTGQQNYVNIAHESVPGQLVLHTSHLSTFTLFWFDPSKWLRDLQVQVERALGLQHPKPGCVDENLGRAADLGDFDFLAEGPGLGTVWLCAGRASTGDLSMQIYSNSPAAFEITADEQPMGIVQIAKLSLAEALTTSLYNVSAHHPTDRSLLAPGGSLSFRAEEADVPVGYHAAYQPGVVCRRSQP